MTKPLEGVRVLELARVLAGPWIGQTMADLGADVIKVEAPGGDETRGWGRPLPPHGASSYFHSCNRGKRSIALDFRDPEDLRTVRALAREADVLLENFKVGGLKKFALDHPTLSAANPRLITCSVTGFGQDGPRAPQAGYDFIIQAMGGIMDLTGEPDGEPQKPGVAYADLFTGLYGVIAVQAALLLREKTGLGQHIDMSLFDTQLAVLANQASSYLMTGEVPKRMGNTHPSIVPYQVFHAADGPLVIACGNDGQFVRLSEALGAGFHRDPRFRTNNDRLEHRDALVALLEDRLAAMPRGDVIAAMEAAGVPAGPINNVGEAFSDPQAEFRGMAIPLDGHRGVRTPIRATGMELSLDRPAPGLDADGADIHAALRHAAGWPD
ncbi:MAG: CaiB/BaiF CoA transferase family protein [Paracoccaceae bacterium]